MANRLSSPDDPRAMWEAAAPGWVKWEGVIAAGFADATERLLDMAGVRQAMRVLDVACGGGSQSVAAARRVGPGGEVLATDISPAMLEHVRRRAAREGLGHIHTLESAAEECRATDCVRREVQRSIPEMRLAPSPRRRQAVPTKRNRKVPALLGEVGIHRDGELPDRKRSAAVECIRVWGASALNARCRVGRARD